jgi:ubiquinone/menaquinone biosynthesis C-methylase UbiE
MPATPFKTEGLQIGEAFRPETNDDEVVRLMVTLLDLQDATLAIRRLRDWALGLAQVTAGEVVVDVGSGTGTVVRELASLVGPTGRVTGVEPNPKLRAIAAERTTGIAGAEFVDGLADALPFPDASVDLVWCERVLQHLSDAQAAVTEFARVLRPGGRAVILDSDHDSRVTSDLDYEIEAKIRNAFLAATPNARAARHVPRQAVMAGLHVDPDIGAVGLIMPPLPDGGPSLIEMAARQAEAAGVLTPAETEGVIQSQRAAADAGYAFSAVTVFGFVLRKPSAPGPTTSATAGSLSRDDLH